MIFAPASTKDEAIASPIPIEAPVYASHSISVKFPMGSDLCTHQKRNLSSKCHLGLYTLVVFFFFGQCWDFVDIE